MVCVVISVSSRGVEPAFTVSISRDGAGVVTRSG
jgi:hypothetical protein